MLVATVLGLFVANCWRLGFQHRSCHLDWTLSTATAEMLADIIESSHKVPQRFTSIPVGQAT